MELVTVAAAETSLSILKRLKHQELTLPSLSGPLLAKTFRKVATMENVAASSWVNVGLALQLVPKDVKINFIQRHLEFKTKVERAVIKLWLTSD